MLTILFCVYLISLISRFRKNHTQKAKKLYGSIHTENFNPTKYIPYTVSFLPLLLIVCSMCSRLLTYTKFITNLHVIYIATVPNYACMPMLIIIMVTAEMCQYLVSPSSQSLNVSIFVYIFRCDQYRWIHQGTRPLNHPSGVTIYRKSSVIDADSDDRHGDKRFKDVKMILYVSYVRYHRLFLGEFLDSLTHAHLIISTLCFCYTANRILILS